MASCLGCMRTFLHVLCLLILIAATVLTIVALATVHWQEANYGEGENKHHHGLWRDCIFFYKKNTETCYLREQDEDINNHQYGHPHEITESRLTVLILCVVTVLPFGLIACIIGIVTSFANCFRSTKTMQGLLVTWCVMIGISTTLIATAVIIFFYRGYSKDERFLEDLGSTKVLQEFGWSFWCAVGSTVLYLGALIIAIISSVLFCVTPHLNNDNPPKYVPKTWPKYNANSTSV